MIKWSVYVTMAQLALLVLTVIANDDRARFQPKGKRKFISKNKAVTFHLVHRSQQDPLITDETAPQHVLVASQSSQKKSSKQIEDEHKFGIFFDDDYNYLQHLKGDDDLEVHWEETTHRAKQEKPKKMQLPSSVFASEVEESVGLLNRAAPQSGLRLDLDPDIVAAMDEDFDFDDPDNVLEDDFIALANQSGSDDECESDDGSYETIDEEEDDEEADGNSTENEVSDDDELGQLPDNFGDVETKSRFTDYSLSSSVMRRNDQLSLLDDRFEKMFEGYDKTDIGPLDCEEIEGHLTSTDQRLLDLADEYARRKDGHIEQEDLKDKILTLVHDEDSDEDYLEKMYMEEKKERWDCESVLSTYSNIYNHPAKIVEPKQPRKIKVNRIGVAVEELDGRGGPKLTASNLAALNGTGASPGPRSIVSMVSELSIRPKDETPEERRIRKANLREYRQERRLEKKANTLAFQKEKIRQEKVLLNQKNNQRGIKIL